MKTDGLIHLVRTTHHDTGQVDLLCGATRPGLEEPAPGSPPCGECLVEAININRRDISTLASSHVEWTEHTERQARISYGSLDAFDRALERLDKRIRKIEKKGKRS